MYFGDVMIFKIDYEHIFFDRYSLSEEEKKAEAFGILEKLFEGAQFDKDKCMMKVGDCCAREEKEFNRKLRLIKREFFILALLWQEPPLPVKEPDIIDVAEKYIREKYLYDYFCASYVCEYCNVTRKVLDNGFNKRFSKSVSEYIKYIRVKKAAELIGMGERMDKIAELCGFGSIKTMQRAFKTVYGKTPVEYRSGRLDSRDSK